MFGNYKYPWSDKHGFNLDWVIEQVEANKNAIESLDEKIKQLPSSNTINVGNYATKRDGTDETEEVLEAVALALMTGSNLYFPKGVYGVKQTIPHYDKLAYFGDGVDQTIIKALTGFVGDAIIQTDNFGVLTGTNAWFVSEGVRSEFTLADLGIDGSGLNLWGVQYYGKGYFVRRVKIYDCNDDGVTENTGGGFYTECGDKTGQNEASDMPESMIVGVYTRNCDGKGLLFRGPHDGFLSNIYINGNFKPRSEGFICEKDAGVYSGIADIGDVHVYAVQKNGFKTNVSVRANSIIAEAIKTDAIILESSYNQVSKIVCYGDTWLAGTTIMKVDGSQNHIPNVNLRNTSGLDLLVLDVNGNDNIINGHVIGDGNGDGLHVDGRGHKLNINVIGFEDGVILNNDGNFKDHVLDLNIRGCVNPLEVKAGGVENNIVTLSGYNNTNNVIGSFTEFDDVMGNLVIGGVSKRAKYSTQLNNVIDLQDTTEQDIVIPLSMLYNINPNETTWIITAVTDGRFAIDFVRLKAWSSTSATLTVKLGTAAPVSSTASIGVSFNV